MRNEEGGGGQVVSILFAGRPIFGIVYLVICLFLPHPQVEIVDYKEYLDKKVNRRFSMCFLYCPLSRS